MIKLITSIKAKQKLIEKLEQSHFKGLYECYEKPSIDKTIIYLKLKGKYNNMVSNCNLYTTHKMAIIDMGIISYNKFMFTYGVIIQSDIGKLYYLETPTQTKLTTSL